MRVGRNRTDETDVTKPGKREEKSDFIRAAYLSILPFSPVGMAISIGLTVLLCHIFRVPDHARLAAIIVAVIMVVSSADPLMNPL
jgi:hypothetical protein